MPTLDIKLDLDLETQEVDGKRYYLTPIGLLPSMTTILSRYKDAQGGLDKWKAKVGEARAEKIKNNAAEFGTAIHEMAEAHIMGNSLPELDFFQQGRWQHLRNVIDERFGKVHACETALYSKLLRTAGRTDVIGEFDGVKSVIDFKNSNKPKKVEWIETYFLQGAGYSTMYYELTRDPETTPKQIVIINTQPHDDPQIFIEPVGKWIPRLKEVVAEYA